MRHAAVSISITSLTDALAFLIGSIAPLPAVMYFCYYSSAAIVFIFLYCLTMFVAVLSLQGRREQELKHSVTGAKTVNLEDYGMGMIFEKPIFFLESASGKQLLLKMGSRVSVKADEENNNNEKEVNSEFESDKKDVRMWYQKFFEDTYAPFISNPKVAFLSLFLYLGYLTAAFYGSQNLKIGFDVSCPTHSQLYPRPFPAYKHCSRKLSLSSFPGSSKQAFPGRHKDYGHCCYEIS